MDLARFNGSIRSWHRISEENEPYILRALFPAPHRWTRNALQSSHSSACGMMGHLYALGAATACRRANITFDNIQALHFHVLRHTFTSNIIYGGASLKMSESCWAFPAWTPPWTSTPMQRKEPQVLPPGFWIRVRVKAESFPLQTSRKEKSKGNGQENIPETLKTQGFPGSAAQMY